MTAAADKAPTTKPTAAMSCVVEPRPKEWSFLANDYKFIKKQGEGSFGQVYRAQCLRTNKIVAIKHVTGIFKHNYAAKKMLRELYLLIELSKDTDSNMFCTQLLDIVVPGMHFTSKEHTVNRSDPNKKEGDQDSSGS